MPTDVISVTIDPPQPRIVGDRLAQVISGKEWDLPASSPNAGVDNVTFTGMLLPLPFDPLWVSNPTGNYARLRKSELSIAGSSDWTEFQRAYTGDWYMQSQDANDKVYTLESFEQNRPMFLSWVNYNSGNEARISIDCGWGESTDAEISLRFWSNGDVEIWKNGEQFGSAKINEKVYYASPFGPQQSENGSASQMLANQIVDVCLIPCRRGELLCLSNQGGGFNFFFDDLDENNPDPMITGPGQFWFQVPEGQATAQVAKLNFKASGYLLSPVFRYREAPITGESHVETVSYDTPGYGTQSVTVSLKESNGTTNFVPNGTLQEARIRVDMTADNHSTPFVYVATSAFDALTATLPGDGIDLSTFWMQLDLEVPEDPEQVTCNITCRMPGAMEDAGATNVTTQGNRDVIVAIGDLNFYIGRSGDAEWEEEPSDDTRQLVLETYDRMIRRRNYRIQDPEPVDAFNFSDAIYFFAKMPGFDDDDLDIEFIDYRLPALSHSSDGEFAMLPEVGDTPAQWIRKLREEFALKCYYGEVPTVDGPKFRFATPEGLGTESQRTLYLHPDDAIADGADPEDQSNRIYFSKPRYMVPEANDIYVVGRDVRRNRPIIAHYRDFASADPTLDPEDRTENWVGEIRQFGYVDPSLTTEADVIWVMGQFAEVLPVRRELREIRGQFLRNPLTGVPLWRGDCITVRNRGKYRIRTLSLMADLEKADPTDAAFDRIWRQTSYVCERVGGED